MQENDLISKSAVREIVNRATRYVVVIPDTGKGYDGAVLIDEIMLGVEKEPATDAAQVVHARWIPGDGEDSDATECYNWECSHCHGQVEYIDPHPFDGLDGYCGKCGARMDAEVV